MVDKVNNIETQNIEMKDESESCQKVANIKVKVVDEEKAEEFKNKGNEAFKANDFKQALEYYSEAIKCSNNELIYTNRAACLIQLKQYSEALCDCQTAINLNPNLARAYMRSFKCHYNLGNLKNAKECLEKAIALGDSTAEKEKKSFEELLKYEKYIIQAEQNSEYKEALHYTNNILKMCTDSIFYISRKIEFLIKLNRLAEAIDFTTTVQNQFINNPEYLYWRGLLLLYNGNTDMGKKYIREAVNKDPDNVKFVKAQKNLIKTEKTKKEAGDLFQAGKYQDAIALYTECLNLDPLNIAYNSTVLFNRSAAYSKLSMHKEAISDLDEAIKLNEDYVKAYIKRGDVFFAMEEFENAQRDYTKAAQLDPQQRHVLKQKINETKTQIKIKSRKDYYKILEITKSASDDDIKKAYKKMALKWHPDKFHSQGEEERLKAEKVFKDIGEAYAVLSDADKKRMYDQGADLEEINQGGHGFGGHGVDPNDIFKMFFAQGGPGRSHMGGMGGGGGGHQFHFTFQ